MSDSRIFSGWLLAFCALLISVAASAPEQIALNYGANPSEMVVTWATMEPNPSLQFIQYGHFSHLLTNSVEASVTQYSTSSYTSPFLYKAVIPDLKEGNNKYFYRVGSEDGGYSDTFSFKSHPGVGVNDVTFHLIGDLGQTQNSISTLEEMQSDEEKLNTMSGGLILVGDLSYANGNQPEWDNYGNMKQFVATSIPIFNTDGNHEWFDSSDKSFGAYKSRFDNPRVNGEKELYYSFDAGRVHWTMVSGYCEDMKSVLTQPCLAEDTPQHDWLVADLAAVNKTSTPWTIVVFHQPYVNSNYAHDMKTEGKPMQEAIETILFNAKVDLVFSGHVHAYERSCQVYQYECVEGAPYYITIGDGGNAEGLASTWEEPQPDWSIFRQSSYGHGELTAVNSTHMYWEWRQNGDLDPVGLDTFWFVKGEESAQPRAHFTGVPKFADSDRGRLGAAFNDHRLAEHM